MIKKIETIVESLTRRVDVGKKQKRERRKGCLESLQPEPINGKGDAHAANDGEGRKRMRKRGKGRKRGETVLMGGQT